MPPIKISAQPEFASRRYQQRYTPKHHADHRDETSKTPAKISATPSEAVVVRMDDNNVLAPFHATFYAAKLKSQLLNLCGYAPIPDDIPGQSSVMDRDTSRFPRAGSLQANGRSPTSEAHSPGETHDDPDDSLKETPRADEVYDTLMTRIYQ